MSLLKKMAGAFVEFDETDQPQTTPKPQTTGATATAVSTVIPTGNTVPIASVVDPEMISALQKVVGARKTAYTALVETSDKMRGVIPDDTTRLKAAFATIASDGRTIDNITQALDMHISDVNSEVMRFKQSATVARTQRVDTLRASIQSIKTAQDSRMQSITNLQAQIADLQKTIAAEDQKSTDLTNQANAAEAEINATTAKFEAAADAVKQDLTNKKSQLASALV